MTRFMRKGLLVRAALTVGLAISSVRPTHAQGLPSEPVVLGNGHLTINGDLSGTFSCAHAYGASDENCADDAGFFNYTDYNESALRMLRVEVTASLQANRHLWVLGEVRSENISRIEAAALYLRIRPWAARSIDIQAGRIPPTFGGFARRSYAADNPLIGYPLAYQYLTSLRADSLPANADELLRMRGRGWLSNFTIGNTAPARGVPLVTAFRWDTGVQVHASTDIIDATAAVTTGTLSNPRVDDDNGGKQVVGRVAVRPLAGLVLGVSAARGPFVSRAAAGAAGATEANRFTQTAWEGDAEYSRGYYMVRVETVVSRWRIPTLAPASLPLTAVATAVEGRYKITPRLYAAARADHLGFSEVVGVLTRTPWEAPVTRVEIGGGYALQRNLSVKLSFQHDKRPVGRVTRLNALGTQITYWF